MTRFRIYYADGTVFTDGDKGKPNVWEVICILQKRGDSARYHMVSGTPSYMFVDDEWIPAWDDDVKYRVAFYPDTIKALIFGMLVTKERFSHIYEQAKKDREKECLHN